MPNVIIFPLVFLSVIICANAQTIHGTVMDKDEGKPLYGASILLKDTKGIPVSYVHSGSDGRFIITVPQNESPDSIILEVRLLGYSVFRHSPPFPQTLEVGLEKVPMELPEVVVQAGKVEKKGDTVTFYIPSLVSTEDRTLGDVLTKLPGINVDKAGYIRVYGRSINKFYIEGTDLLEHRYNIATKNLDPKDIKEVRIYENHQPVKALEGVVETERSAIDIILKESSRDMWLGTVQAEAGGSAQAPRIPYSVSGMAMNISRKFQTVNTIKTDAAGNSIFSMLNNSDFTADIYNIDFQKRYIPNSYTSSEHDSPPIDESRTRFNTSYSATTSNKFPIGGKNRTSIGVSAIYEAETLNSENEINQTYDIGNGEMISFTEKNDVHSNTFTGYANINATVNTEKLYLRENFQFEISGRKTGNTLSGSKERSESSDNDGINILNFFSFFKRMKNTAFGLQMFTQYSEIGEALEIRYRKQKDTGTTDTDTQNISGKYFFNSIEYSTSYSPFKWFVLHSSTSLDFLRRRFTSTLSGLPEITTADTENDILMQYFRLNESISADFIVNRFKATVSAETRYQYTDCKTIERSIANHFAINPEVYAHYDFGPRFRISAGGKYVLSPPDEQKIFSGIILRNYRYLTQGRTTIEQLPGYTVYGTLDFKEPVSGWFVKAKAQWDAGKTFQRTRYILGEDYIIDVESNDVKGYAMLSASGEISKAFMHISGKLTGSFDYSRLSASIYQNDFQTDYSCNTYTAGLKYNGSIAEWLSLQYNGTYSLTNYILAGNRDTGSIHSLNCSLMLSFFPLRSLEFDISGEYYHNRYDPDTPKHSFFIDASAWYFINNRFQLFLHAKNILDERTYSSSYTNPLQTTRYCYRIRPLNILVGLQIKF